MVPKQLISKIVWIGNDHQLLLFLNNHTLLNLLPILFQELTAIIIGHVKLKNFQPSAVSDQTTYKKSISGMFRLKSS